MSDGFWPAMGLQMHLVLWTGFGIYVGDGLGNADAGALLGLAFGWLATLLVLVVVWLQRIERNCR